MSFYTQRVQSLIVPLHPNALQKNVLAIIGKGEEQQFILFLANRCSSVRGTLGATSPLMALEGDLSVRSARRPLRQSTTSNCTHVFTQVGRTFISGFWP